MIESAGGMTTTKKEQDDNRFFVKEYRALKKIFSALLILLFLVLSQFFGKYIAREGFSRYHSSLAATPSNPFPEASPLHVPFETHMKPLFELPEFKEWVKRSYSSSKNLDQANVDTAILLQKGISRLGNEDLERRMHLTLVILEKLDPARCSVMLRGSTVTDNVKLVNEGMFKVLEQLDSESSNAWFELNAKSIIAELKKYPVQVLSEKKIDSAWKYFMTSIKEPDRGLITKLLSDPAWNNDQEVCRAGKKLYKLILRTDQPTRAVLCRSLFM